ncbi:MAG: P-loop NTPase [Chloroflexi bacterium]|nr:P-loop NTPase [Chloroflexota bacterium]MBV9134268.1 P-loop NTPase [Chloroflexota bacterium]MBV9898527.1 P-loop NTPase [Chloroflexota bacterium]
MDERAVRELLAALTDSAGTPLLAEELITSVTVEPGWIAVILTEQPVPRDVLVRAHSHLSAACAGYEVELRCGGRVFRGGYGFGAKRHVIAVIGGKGGVGKSTIAVSLSLTLAAMGFRVGVLDGDLNGPDIPHMLGVHPKKDRQRGAWPRERVNAIRAPQSRRKPYQRWGLEVMSVGFVVTERAPLAATGRWLVSSLLRNLIFDVAWTADIIVIDAPPGTGEEIQVMVRELPLSGAVFVTTPQDLAQMDAERTLAHLREHDVPVIGMVQNMASLSCPHCAESIDLYGASTRLEDAGVRVLGRIPFDTRLSVTADRGLPLVLGDPRGPVAYEFARISASVRRWLADRDQQLLDAAAA